MGFFTDIVNEGFYGAFSNIYHDQKAREICHNVGVPYVKLSGSDYSSSSAIELESEQPQNEEEANKSDVLIEYPLEIIETKFTKHDILRNIAAAVNHFGISDNEDILIARTQIAAILYMSGLSDTDTIFEALNKDAAAYAKTNELVRMYSGEAMDEKIIPMDIGKDIDDVANEKLRMLADWELEYLPAHIQVGSDACQQIHKLLEGVMGSK